MTPRVSIVVPTFNNAAFIEATLDSIFGQTYEDFELVIADHSSTDGTFDLLRRHAGDPRVRLLVTPPGGGAERNWNRVTDEAHGDLIKLVCGDDLLYPELLARQVAALDGAGAEVAMVASSRDIIDPAGRIVLRNVGLAGLEGRVAGRTALRRSVHAGANIFGEPSCVLLRRGALTAIGGWHGRPEYLIDQATYSRVLLDGDVVALPGPLAAFRLSTAQLSVRLSKSQAASAAEMHRQLAAAMPGLLSPADVWRGNTMATVRAAQRRLLYLILGRRLQHRST